MPHYFDITIGAEGGEVEYHVDDREQVDHVLGGLGISIGDEFRADHGRSTTARAQVTAYPSTDLAGLNERTRDAFRELGYSIGVM